MKRSESGFTFIEFLVAAAIVALIAGAASMAIFQVINVTKSTNDHMTVIRQAQNAGYWISRDALMAQQMVVGDDPETTFFLNLTWTEWHEDKKKDSIYHEVTYSLQDLSDEIGKLVRNHWSSAGADEQTLVAEYIYYNPDEDNTTRVSYQTPVLTVQITASFGEATETREYTVKQRPNF